MGRPSNTTQRRAEIVQGLLRVMAKRGYDGASIANIAQAAGLAPGLVHYHFRDKQEILLALGEELVSRVRARYQARSQRAMTDWERLCAFIDAHVELGRDADPDAVACWVMLGAEAVRDPEVQKLYRRATQQSLDELLILVVALMPSCDAARAKSVAATLLSAIEGAYHLAISARITPRGFAAPMLREMAETLLKGRAA